LLSHSDASFEPSKFFERGGDDMSSDESAVDPVMQAWIDEQMRHFPPGSMDAAIRQLRAYERADRDRGVDTKAGAA
jgi:hypothetical protein